jgi:hypothetical protein
MLEVKAGRVNSKDAGEVLLKRETLIRISMSIVPTDDFAPRTESYLIGQL